MKKYMGMLAAALCVLGLAACTADPAGSETEAPTDGDTPAITNPAVTDGSETTPATETEPETEKETAPVEYSELDDLQKLVTPFWLMDTMHRESTCMIVRDDGSITAKLAFKPTKIISVESNDFKTVYELDKDYTWDGESNVIVWKEGSAIKYFTQNDIRGKREDGTYVNQFDGTAASWDELGRSRFGDQLYCVSAFLYEKQIAVTYEYEYGAWDGEMTAYQGETLTKTMQKLKAGETINLFYYGDSIFTGCDSSAMYNREPFQKSFPEFTKQLLEATYGGRVKLYNPSVGGMQSQWGAENAQSLICDRATPDLVIIGFGMNDQDSGRTSANNIQSIIKTVRAANPDCEFIVVSCMVPNAAAGFLVKQNQLSDAYRSLANKNTGVAFVDMYACHEKLLAEKDFISMSGNNINHPNDWLIRVYGMQILSTMVEW